MTRVSFFVYGVVCHLLFLVVYAWLGAFFAGLPILPKTIDSPAGGAAHRGPGDQSRPGPGDPTPSQNGAS